MLNRNLRTFRGPSETLPRPFRGPSPSDPSEDLPRTFRGPSPSDPSEDLPRTFTTDGHCSHIEPKPEKTHFFYAQPQFEDLPRTFRDPSETLPRTFTVRPFRDPSEDLHGLVIFTSFLQHNSRNLRTFRGPSETLPRTFTDLEIFHRRDTMHHHLKNQSRKKRTFFMLNRNLRTFRGPSETLPRTFTDL